MDEEAQELETEAVYQVVVYNNNISYSK